LAIIFTQNKPGEPKSGCTTNDAKIVVEVVDIKFLKSYMSYNHITATLSFSNPFSWSSKKLLSPTLWDLNLNLFLDLIDLSEMEYISSVDVDANDHFFCIPGGPNFVIFLNRYGDLNITSMFKLAKYGAN
jgi:hypothetical protein